MGYVARSRLRWDDGWIEPGQPVPAHTARNYDLMLAAGQIEGEAEPEPPSLIVVPYVTLGEGTQIALDGRRVEYVDVSASETSYWELLSFLWTEGDTFTIVEHDVVPAPDTIAGFQRCRRAWCCAPYPLDRSPAYPGLGCCRFRDVLLRAHPDLMDDVAVHKYAGHCFKHWCILDAAIQRELWRRKRGACTAHRHVAHRAGPPSHGCCRI